MKTLLNALVINEASSLDLNMNRPLSADRNGAMASRDSHAVAGNSVAKNVLMFVAAPFIALGFIIALPAIGFYYIARFAIRALSKRLASSSAGVQEVHTAALFASSVNNFDNLSASADKVCFVSASFTVLS